jgi:uncharacterized protein YbaR (Trm112 family)
LLSQDIVRLLACPVCRVDVMLDGETILCGKCGRRYPIRGGIPIMLVEEADTPPGAPAGDVPEDGCD